MTIQTTFDDICANRHGGNTCSVDANKRVNKAADREAILRLISAEKNGLTLKEACLVMMKTPNQISGRFSELKRDGLIVTEGRRDGCGVNYLIKRVDVCA